VAEVWNGTGWSATGTPADYISGVSCSGVGQCVGVGTIGPGTGTAGAEGWNGTSWTADTLTNPGQSAYLAGVSCRPSGHCVAVGGYQTPSSQDVPLVQVAGPSSTGVAPTVVTGAATKVAATTTVLHGSVNSDAAPTSCVFQWGASDGPYTHSVSAPCAFTSTSVPVSLKLTDLVAGSSYEYRLRATNPSGTTVGAERRFATPSSGGISTLGNATVGDQVSSFQSDLERVNPYELYWPGVARSLSIYLQPTATSGSQSVQLMLYADAAGAPGKLLARTGSLVFKSSDPAGWYRLSLDGPASLPVGQYWIGVITGGQPDVVGWRYDDTGTRDTRSRAFSLGPSDPFGATSQDTAVISLFATLSPGSGQTAAMARRAHQARLQGHARLRIAAVRCRRGCTRNKTPH
jgi:hypothetical protein